MTEVQKFSAKVIDQFSKSITDSVFLMIQNDRYLMRSYLKLVNKFSATTVNQNVGKAIKEAFKLTNQPKRQDKPRSTLIQSHQIF